MVGEVDRGEGELAQVVQRAAVELEAAHRHELLIELVRDLLRGVVEAAGDLVQDLALPDEVLEHLRRRLHEVQRDRGAGHGDVARRRQRLVHQMAELVEEGLHVLERHERGLALLALGEVHDHRRHGLAVAARLELAAVDDAEGRAVRVLAVAREEVEIEIPDLAAGLGVVDAEEPHVLVPLLRGLDFREPHAEDSLVDAHGARHHGVDGEVLLELLAVDAVALLTDLFSQITQVPRVDPRRVGLEAALEGEQVRQLLDAALAQRGHQPVEEVPDALRLARHAVLEGQIGIRRVRALEDLGLLVAQAQGLGEQRLVLAGRAAVVGELVAAAHVAVIGEAHDLQHVGLGQSDAELAVGGLLQAVDVGGGHALELDGRRLESGVVVVDVLLEFRAQGGHPLGDRLEPLLRRGRQGVAGGLEAAERPLDQQGVLAAEMSRAPRRRLEGRVDLGPGHDARAEGAGLGLDLVRGLADGLVRGDLRQEDQRADGLAVMRPGQLVSLDRVLEGALVVGDRHDGVERRAIGALRVGVAGLDPGRGDAELDAGGRGRRRDDGGGVDADLDGARGRDPGADEQRREQEQGGALHLTAREPPA